VAVAAEPPSAAPAEAAAPVPEPAPAPAPPPPRSSTGAWVAVLVVVSLLALGVGLVLGRLSAPVPTVAVTPPPVRAAPAVLVTEEGTGELDRAGEAATPGARPPDAPPPAPPRRSSGDAHQRSTKRSAPLPEPAAEPEVAVNMGSVAIEGGSCRLVGEDGGELGCGAVPAGRYAIWARPSGGAEIALGSHVVGTGRTLRVKCGFGTCRLR
jgi:hypothetical protein